MSLMSDSDEKSAEYYLVYAVEKILSYYSQQIKTSGQRLIVTRYLVTRW